MNLVIQTVTLCKDPEIKEYGEGKSLAKFNGAVNKRFAKEGEANADFFNYVAFGKTAEFISKYFKKGSKMLINGEVQNNNYEGKDGKTVYGTQILINSVEFYGSKKDNEASGKEDTSAKSTSSDDDDYDDF